MIILYFQLIISVKSLLKARVLMEFCVKYNFLLLFELLGFTMNNYKVFQTSNLLITSLRGVTNTMYNTSY